MPTEFQRCVDADELSLSAWLAAAADAHAKRHRRRTHKT